MEIIIHRANTIKKLKKISTNYGAEIDLRSSSNDIILSHEPFKKGEIFNNWLKFYSHKTLILNIKEEGLEKKILKILKKHNIKNFFLLDQSFPFLIKYSTKFLSKTAGRISEYESIETIKKIKNKIKWVWVDCFSRFPLSKNKYNILKRMNLKLCYVSPELQGVYDTKKIRKFIIFLLRKKMFPDAVCTKYPKLWKKI